jgi:hypothetical protein
MNAFVSGDTDAVVPVTATRYSIDALKLPTIINWYPWYDNGKVSAQKDIYISNQKLKYNCLLCYKLISYNPNQKRECIY